LSNAKILLAGFLAFTGLPAAARLESGIRAAESSVIAAERFKVPFKEFTLKNGLRVILSEDHSAPTYSICVTYNVGSHNERPGRTGFAHLFEHMMFQGSENVGKGEHFILVLNNGGSANGTTNADRTNYFQTLPANQLELGLFLEADRMRSLNINQANFDNQRQTARATKR
jgi:predicted Zn-dependent peptidase